MNKRIQIRVKKLFWMQSVLLFLIIVLSTAVFAQGEQKDKDSLQLILKAAKTNFIEGETIEMRLDIQNINSMPVIIFEPKINESVEDWSLLGYISPPGGREFTAEPSQSSASYHFKKEDFIQLKPGEKTSIEIRFDSPARLGYSWGGRWWFKSIPSDGVLLQ